MIIFRWQDVDTVFEWLDVDYFFVKEEGKNFYVMAKLLDIITPLHLIIQGEKTFCKSDNYSVSKEFAETFVKDFNSILDFIRKKTTRKKMRALRKEVREKLLEEIL